jgi:hypothetical protein
VVGWHDTLVGWKANSGQYTAAMDRPSAFGTMANHLPRGGSLALRGSAVLISRLILYVNAASTSYGPIRPRFSGQRHQQSNPTFKNPKISHSRLP